MGYNQYDSDYQIRIATLGALGGDTARTFDSVYDVDLAILEAIEQGGGGEGMNYNQIKAALAASGVTEILVNGDGESITLDYDLLSQIGQGGGSGDYICVDSVDALSGITSPKDGMIAYVAGKGMWKYYAATAITKWLIYDVDLNALSAGEINTMCTDYMTYLRYGYVPTITVQFSNSGAAIIGGDQYWRLQAVAKSIITHSGVTAEITFSSACFADHSTNYLNAAYLPKIYFTTFIRRENVWSEVPSDDIGYRKHQSLMTEKIWRETRNYILGRTLEQLSAYTPEDGAIAYLGEYDRIEERMVLRMDYYGGWNYLRIAYNDGNTLTLETWDNGHATSFGGNAKYYKYGDGNSDTMNDHQSDLPQDFMYNANGAIGTYASMEEGDEYSTNGDYKNTFYFKKYDGAYPTITWEPAGECTTVSSSLTTENITVHYTEKGWYKYYANISGGTWLPYEIMWDSLDPTDRIDIINQFVTYKQPLKAYKHVNNYGNSLREFNAIGYSTDWEHPEIVNGVNFFAKTEIDPSATVKIPSFSYTWNGDQQTWEYNSGFQNLEREGTGYQNIRQYAVQIPTANNEYFAAPNTIYNIPISGVVSGTVFSTEVVADPTDHDWDEYCFKFYNGWAGFDCWFHIRKDGYIKAAAGSGLVIPAEALDPNGNEWTICNYFWQDEPNSGNGGYAVAAVRMIENVNSNYQVEMFVSLPQDGYQDMYNAETNSEKSYIWTQTSGQTMEIQPMIYSYGVVDKTPRVYKFKLN